MKRYWQGLHEWLEHRTGVHTAVRHFLYEEIPASAGWHQVFGSVAMFLILVQFFTGIMLAFNYAPTPGEAYNSLRYILTEVTAGRLMRGLHHWGASMIIVVVVLHMVQVFLWGAYKKPRETTWMVGVVLLLLTLAYGLTGYLLPWDNRAYWGTVVTTQIAAMAPGLGPYATRLLGGDGVGVVTFARFYGLHVLLLPPATLLLIALHVYLVRKHGVAPAPGDEHLPKKKFYPEQVFKDTVAIFIAFGILFTLAVAVRVPLEQLADPTDTSYIPRPEWYFLFLFQTLKLFEGPLEVVGAVVLPGLAVLTLMLVPFLDRTRVMRVTKRTTAIAVVLFAAIGWGGLTAAAVISTPKEARTVEVDYSKPIDWMQITPDEMTGVAFFRQANCGSCHAVGETGGHGGPDLSKVAVRKDSEWLLDHVKKNSGKLTPVQATSLAGFSGKLHERVITSLENAPDFAAQGAVIYQANHCASCHTVNGMGMKVGPALNGLGKRQSRSWVIGHFVDPQKLAPGTIMPAYKLPAKDLEILTTYLFSLPEGTQ